MAEHVACSVCEIIDTQNASGVCARCTNRPHEHHGFSLGRILTDLMGREFSVFVERSPASDSVRIAARCRLCRVAQDYVCEGESFRHYLVHDRAKLVEGFARDWKCNCALACTELVESVETPRVAPNYSLRDALKIAYEHMGESMPSDRFHVNIGGEVRAVEPEPIDPMERMVDGLTVAECWRRWRHNNYAVECAFAPTTLFHLTGAQCAAAKEHDSPRSAAWSAALRAKQEEARERERNEVLVDIQEVE